MRRKWTFHDHNKGMSTVKCGSSCRAKPLVCRPISRRARSIGGSSSPILIGQERDGRKLFRCIASAFRVANWSVAWMDGGCISSPCFHELFLLTQLSPSSSHPRHVHVLGPSRPPPLADVLASSAPQHRLGAGRSISVVFQWCSKRSTWTWHERHSAPANGEATTLERMHRWRRCDNVERKWTQSAT